MLPHLANIWDIAALAIVTPIAGTVVVTTGTPTGTIVVAVIVTTAVMIVGNVTLTAETVAVIGVTVVAHLLVAATPPNTGGAEATPGVLPGEAAPLDPPETTSLHLAEAPVVKVPGVGKGMSHLWLMSFRVCGVRRFFSYFWCRSAVGVLMG
jgi:hypothetical protein